MFGISNIRGVNAMCLLRLNQLLLLICIEIMREEEVTVMSGKFLWSAIG